ncbi:MAG: hypothetical protein A2144_12680 [Chloroflexi bacterium RBG_16_50_9]|nr:MAG: hypothetical protein A2144_12680 [Chloroflexi bacterium RBG_16_50_9]
MKAQIKEDFIAGLKEAGINFVASLPCSGISLFLPSIADDPHFKQVPLANEGDGVGICAGAWLGGKKPALLVDGAGFVLAHYALMNITYKFGGFPILLVVAHRGSFGDGKAWYHFGDGTETIQILESLRIPYTIVRESQKLKAELVSGERTAEGYGRPAAILLNLEEIW